MSFKYIDEVILGDCLEILPKLPENCVDLAIADLPYNISSSSKITFVSRENGERRIKTTESAWGRDFKDKFTDQAYLLFVEGVAAGVTRVLKEGGNAIFYYDLMKPYYLYPIYESLTIKNVIALPKRNPAPHVRKNNFCSAYEQCAWFCKGEKPKTFNFLSQGEMTNFFPCVERGNSEVANLFYGTIGSANREGKRWHPTQKYRWMVDPLVDILSNPGDLVLDPVCGSGTTMISARDKGRRWCGIEKEKDIYDKCVERMREKDREVEEMEIERKSTLSMFGGRKT